MRTALQKNLTPLPRTVSEATRDAQYACAIQVFKSDTKLALDFLSNALLGFMWVAVIGGSVFALIYWLAFGS